MDKRELLRAPWRVKYISDVAGKNTKCIFCEKARQTDDKKNYVLYRGKNIFVLLNIYPYNNGHLMVAPYNHTGNLAGLSDDVLCEMMDVVKKFVKRIEEKMDAQGFNIGMNIGKVAGAGIDDHIHIHIVPRWLGDTNFMPVVSEVKVISEGLDSVYDKLKL